MKYPKQNTQVVLKNDVDKEFDGMSIQDVIAYLEFHSAEFERQPQYKNIKFQYDWDLDYLQIVGELEESDDAYKIRVNKLKQQEEKQLNKDRILYEKLKLQFEGK